MEYRALTEGVALINRSSVGRLIFTGEDALDLLNRLSTNELIHLELGSGTPTILTSNKGRIIDLLYVFNLPVGLLVLTSSKSLQKVLDWINFYTIMEDIAAKNHSKDTIMLSLAGPKASTILDKLTNKNASSLERFQATELYISGLKTLVCRTDFINPNTYDIISTSSNLQKLWDKIMDAGKNNGIVCVGQNALEIVRIEQGAPAYGRELTEAFNPLEANLSSLVSFTKGCYVGQEVITRLNTYKKVQRHLMGLKWKTDADYISNPNLLFNGKKVGVVTSTIRRHPDIQGRIGLGYIRKAHCTPQTTLTTESTTGDALVEVVNLPFKP